MLKIVFGYGADDETAIGHALDMYNAIEGRKAYHDSKVRQVALDRFRCEIWFTLTENAYIQQEEKHEFIGSTEIDPKDPDWYQKWEALQKTSNENTMEHIADK